MDPFPEAKSLYVHIPFCDGICPYCDFCKIEKSTHLEQGYVEALLFDVRSLSGRKFDTVYVGGGTPTCLDIPNLEAVLSALRPLLDKDGEFTVEANPESLEGLKIDLLSSYGVNRVSLGMQSSLPKNLAFLGRKHDFRLVKECVEGLRKKGIDNVNLDLMYGLPEESLEDVEKDLDSLISLRPTHISTYSLILEPGTVFSAKGIKEGEEGMVAMQYEAINKRLKQAGYHRYEVSNFALPGYESRHNTIYWKNKRYVGLGAGASGFEDNIRYRNTFSVPSFIHGRRRVEEEVVDKDADRSYFLLTGLRLAEGIDLGEFESRFDENLLESKKDMIEKNERLGNIEIIEGRLRVKEEKMILLDRVILDLL